MRLKKNPYGIRGKNAISMILCQIVFVLVVSVYLVSYMQQVLQEKLTSIDDLSADIIVTQLDTALDQARTLSVYCANSYGY